MFPSIVKAQGFQLPLGYEIISLTVTEAAMLIGATVGISGDVRIGGKLIVCFGQS